MIYRVPVFISFEASRTTSSVSLFRNPSSSCSPYLDRRFNDSKFMMGFGETLTIPRPNMEDRSC